MLMRLSLVLQLFSLNAHFWRIKKIDLMMAKELFESRLLRGPLFPRFEWVMNHYWCGPVKPIEAMCGLYHTENQSSFKQVVKVSHELIALHLLLLSFPALYCYNW